MTRLRRDCVYCGSPNDCHDEVSVEAMPSPGDVSICWVCHGVSIFTETGTRRPTPEERAEIHDRPDRRRDVGPLDDRRVAARSRVEHEEPRRMTTCERCGREVIAVLLRGTGREVFLDPEPLAIGNFQRIEPGGLATFIAKEHRQPTSQWYVPPERRYQSHMASCSNDRASAHT